MTSGAGLILKALLDGDITHLFVNLGSDHPAFLAAFARKEFADRIKIFTAPNEMNALSAASGFAQVTGRPSAVLVHVECGTLGLAGAIHNVSKGRIPVMILAGTVPVTMEGELPGSRNEWVVCRHFLDGNIHPTSWHHRLTHLRQIHSLDPGRT